MKLTILLLIWECHLKQKNTFYEKRIPYSSAHFFDIDLVVQ